MWMAFISGEGQLTLLTVFSFALIRGWGDCFVLVVVLEKQFIN